MVKYLYRSVAGDFTIHKEGNQFALCIDGLRLKTCGSAGEAVVAVYSFQTGWKEWDVMLPGFVEPPMSIDEWEENDESNL